MTMTTTVVLIDDATQVRSAVAGFLAGYGGSTRRSYATDLRLFAAWCEEAKLELFSVRRSHLELFGRWMEESGRMRSTVARRLSTLASFYRYCEQEGLIGRNPAANVRRPKVDYESRTLGLARNELGAFLVQAGLGSARDHALASLLALNGLRISEALGADIDDLEFERGHRTLKIVRKGGKGAVIPLAPRTSRALDLYTGERTTGPIFLGAKGERMDRYAADRTVKRLARRAGITKRISPHSLRHSFITAALDAGVPLRDVQEAASHADPRTPCATTGAGVLSTAMPPTSCRRSWPALLAEPLADGAESQPPALARGFALVTCAARGIGGVRRGSAGRGRHLAPHSAGFNRRGRLPRRGSSAASTGTSTTSDSPARAMLALATSAWRGLAQGGPPAAAHGPGQPKVLSRQAAHFEDGASRAQLDQEGQQLPWFAGDGDRRRARRGAIDQSGVEGGSGGMSRSWM